MKYILVILSIFGISICYSQNDVKNNEELTKIYKKDQSDRQAKEIDWNLVTPRDSIRRMRILEMSSQDLLQTSDDFYHAAMVFQHGTDSTSYKKAICFMKSAIKLDKKRSKWLLAAATDRYLLSVRKPQIYGTQYQKKPFEPWGLAKMDTTTISDSVRIEFGVRTLSEQQENLIKMNKSD